jgi:hypothetical protein
VLRNIRVLLFLTVIILKSSIGNSQNLVSNGDFELYSNCPTGFGELFRASGWYNPTAASPDYLNSCSATAGVPLNQAGFQNASSGNGFAGINLYRLNVSSYREYIQTTLINSLSPGVIYCIEFKINLADSSDNYVNSIGAAFSTNAISQSGSGVLNFSPQVETSFYISDSLNWITVRDTFMANGGEKYLTIGNFKSDQNTGSIQINNNNFGALYFIDDVSVTVFDTSCILSTKVPSSFRPENHFNLYPVVTEGGITLTSNFYHRGYLRAYDLTGKLIISENIAFPYSLEFKFSSGLYIFEFIPETDPYIIFREKIFLGENN